MLVLLNLGDAPVTPTKLTENVFSCQSTWRCFKEQNTPSRTLGDIIYLLFAKGVQSFAVYA